MPHTLDDPNLARSKLLALPHLLRTCRPTVQQSCPQREGHRLVGIVYIDSFAPSQSETQSMKQITHTHAHTYTHLLRQSAAYRAPRQR